MPPDAASVLQFEGVDLIQTRSSDSALRDVELCLMPGDLILMEVRRGQLEIPLGDAACGLTRPDRGTVSFGGVSWTDMAPRDAQINRHDIGRFHADATWVSNLNIDENVLLAECHHTGRPEEEILDEAMALAARFELTEITSKRPHLISQKHSRVYQLVRAFLGSPKFVFLERPMRGVVREYGEALMELVNEHRERGCAVIWISSEQEVLDSSKLDATSCFAIEPPNLRAKEGARA
jgi:phospholipid/cholesterol/gamma-HCH transport system ATP-binding protein